MLLVIMAPSGTAVNPEPAGSSETTPITTTTGSQPAYAATDAFRPGLQRGISIQSANASARILGAVYDTMKMMVPEMLVVQHKLHPGPSREELEACHWSAPRTVMNAHRHSGGRDSLDRTCWP
jgi:hypothetical protein